MKAVVDNRLNNNPGQFNASNAATYTDIITASASSTVSGRMPQERWHS
jgi:hypothetical protein